MYETFFGYSKYYSVTEMLLALGLSSFDMVIHNYRQEAQLSSRDRAMRRVN